MMKYLLAIGFSATLSSNAAAIVIHSDFDVPGAQQNNFGHADKVMHTDRGSKSGGPLIVYLPSNSAAPVQAQAPNHTANVGFSTLDDQAGSSPASQPGQPQPSVAAQHVQPPEGFQLPPPSNGKPPFLVDSPISDPLPETTGDSPVTTETPMTVPEPGTLALLGAGLLGLGLLRRRIPR